MVRAEPLPCQFKESSVKEVVTKVLLPLWNSLSTDASTSKPYCTKKATGQDFLEEPLLVATSMENIMDRWILAVAQSMLRFIDEEMRCKYKPAPYIPRSECTMAVTVF